MGWGTMMSPALWQLESDRLPQKGVSRLGSELYGDDNLEADLNKVQTKNYHLDFYVFCKGNTNSQLGSKRVHYKSDLGGKKLQTISQLGSCVGLNTCMYVPVQKAWMGPHTNPKPQMLKFQ
jgi:hypothetical protein